MFDAPPGLAASADLGLSLTRRGLSSSVLFGPVLILIGEVVREAADAAVALRAREAAA